MSETIMGLCPLTGALLSFDLSDGDLLRIREEEESDYPLLHCRVSGSRPEGATKDRSTRAEIESDDEIRIYGEQILPAEKEFRHNECNLFPLQHLCRGRRGPLSHASLSSSTTSPSVEG